MKVLVTGASSGIGHDMAKYLSKLGYDIIAVARSIDGLEKLKNECNTNVKIIPMDLSILNNCTELYDKLKDEDIDILINNAGFGVQGLFSETDLEKEINLINLNITCLHVLTKLFLKDMIKKDKGYILNVSSMAAFIPGPLMSTYYASKAYVLNFTLGINKELKEINSNVHICALCPGPISTNFDKVADVHFRMKYLTSEYVAKYAVDNMLKNKKIIVPGFNNKISRIFLKILPYNLILNVSYYINNRKNNK
jgi:short-subunit dehydrogenase